MNDMPGETEHKLLGRYETRLPALVPAEEAHELSREMLSSCPVARSDVDGGFWIVNRHADVLEIMQHPEIFINGNRGVRVPDENFDRPYQPPIDSNPPMHRSIRSLENPFFAPKALVAQEPLIRQIIVGLIEQFAARGHCDISREFAQVFPALVTFRIFFGIEDDAELAKVRSWVRSLTYDRYRAPQAELVQVQTDWSAWCRDFASGRRKDPRRHDVVDALLFGTVEGGRNLTDEEVVGALEILSFGGFNTTADATANIVVRLIDNSELEPLIRSDPDTLPAIIEEAMRLEPPVTTRPRQAVRDVHIGGKVIRSGDRVLCNYLAANVDPQEWEDADEFHHDRRRNRVMTFGAGPHRCIGSNLARMSLRIAIEELLRRVTGLQFASPDRETRVSLTAGTWRGVDSLPVTFRPREPAATPE
jgi:cytochrome P450